MRCKILGLHVNTFAADEKYPVLNRDNLRIHIQMQLSQKQKNISQFFASFLKSRFNFKHFLKKGDAHRFFIFEVPDSEKVVRQMYKKSSLRGCFDKQYRKLARVLLKSGSQNLCRNHLLLARKLCSKKSLLLTCQNLGLRVTTLATNEKHPVLKKENLTIPIQMQVSQKKNLFLSFLLCFSNLD